jgi:hypothetical protein
LPSMVLAGESLRCFVAGAADQQLHFRVSLEGIDGHDRPGHAAFRQTADPHIDAPSVNSPGLCDKPIVQWVEKLRVARMGTASRPVDDLGGSDQCVR